MINAFEAYIRTLRTRYNQHSFLTPDEIELLTILNGILERADNSVHASIQAQPSERNQRILKRLGFTIEYSLVSWDNFGMRDLI